MGREWAERMVGDRVPCAMHRNVETSLRCSGCGKPICPKCLIHNDRGAQCPRCARAGSGARRGGGTQELRMAAAALLGLVTGMAGGAVTLFVPFGGLLVLPLLLLGVLVGEVVAATAGRPGGLILGLEAFLCALCGPLAGRAVGADLLAGGGSLAAGAGLVSSTEGLGMLGFALLGVGAVVAWIRAAQAAS